MLSAWSSFDDPITALLTVYYAAFVLQAQNTRSVVDGALFGGDLWSFGMNLAVNLLFAGCAYAMWKLARLGEQRFERFGAVRRRAMMRNRQAVALLALLVVGAVAVATGLILGLALIGLFFRPAIGEAVERMTQVALLVATFALGLVLVDASSPCRVWRSAWRPTGHRPSPRRWWRGATPAVTVSTWH